MSLKQMDIQNAMHRVADRRIDDAMLEGKFDNLCAAGAPVELEDMPVDEEARMIWWAVRVLRNNGCADYAVQLSRSPESMR